MLKLNTSGGKLDIVLSEDNPFGQSKRETVKVSPRGNTVSRASHINQGKKSVLSTKPPRTRQAAKSRESKQGGAPPQSRPSRKENGTGRQAKPPKTREKKVTKHGESLDTKPCGTGGSHNAGVLTQGQLLGILNLIKSGNPESSSAREQLSELIASVDATSPPKQQAVVSNRVEDIVRQHESNKTRTKPEVTAELDKNAQWKKELGEQAALAKMRKEKEHQQEKFEEYNPWGRPGAGAPMRTQSGTVIADYHKMSKSQVPTTVDTPPFGTGSTAAVVSHQPPRTSPATTVGSSTSNMETGLPMAMRSSFAVGAPGLVSNETQMNKATQHRQWKEELERQIAEKKEREKQQKLKEHNEDLANATWAQHHDQYRSPPKDSSPRHQTEAGGVPGLPHQVNSSPQTQLARPQATQQATLSLSDINQTGIPTNAPLDGSFKSHARGYGMHLMDPQTVDDMSRKRLKMLEHQRAIQEQVEQKRRLKQEEKSRKMQEEAEEEARLASERDNLNRQFGLELKRKQEKEEEAKRRSEALQQSVLDAYQSAQQAKSEKRRQHLAAGGHDTSGLKANPADVSSRSYVISQGPLTDGKPVGQTSRNTAGSVAGSYGKTSVMSNASPRKAKTSTSSTDQAVAASRSGHYTVNSYDSHSSARFEPESFVVVPPLDLQRGGSPPIPTLRNKIIAKSSPRVKSPISSRAVKSPVSNRRGNMSRTMSSHSEPYVGRTSPSTQRKNKNTSRLDHIVTPTPREDPISSRVVPEEPSRPFSLIEDAFVIPYHRTTSATFPVAPDTPMTLRAPEKGKEKGKEISGRGRSKPVPPGNGTGVTPMYRTPTTHLHDGKPRQEISPRRSKGGPGMVPANRREQQPKVQHPSRAGLYNKAPTKKPSNETVAGRKPNNFQAKSRQDRLVPVKVSPRGQQQSAMSTNHAVAELLPTARQELILEQLRALRQGLMLKERQLRQEAP